MSELNSKESFTAALISLGYAMRQESTHGSRWFTCDGKPGYRLSPYEPNEATACWLKRTGTIDARCQESAEVGDVWETSDLPEFGLEESTDYHTDTRGITSSMLKLFAASPVEFRATYILGTMSRKVPTQPMKLGTICHAMLLEKKRIDEACVEYPLSCYTDGGRLISKRAAEYDARVAPVLAVRNGVTAVIAKVIAAARASAFGRLLEVHADNCLFETRVEAEINGIPCKCRPDLHIVLSDQIIVPDLKFGAFRPDDWRRSASRFAYWLQQAHYTAILEQHYSRPVAWSFWAGESQPPYRFGPKEYDSRSIEMARDRHREILDELKTCYDTNIWEDRYETTLTLAPWDITPDGVTQSSEESEYDDEETTIITGREE